MVKNKEDKMKPKKIISTLILILILTSALFPEPKKYKQRYSINGNNKSITALDTLSTTKLFGNGKNVLDTLTLLRTDITKNLDSIVVNARKYDGKQSNIEYKFENFDILNSHANYNAGSYTFDAFGAKYYSNTSFDYYPESISNFARIGGRVYKNTSGIPFTSGSEIITGFWVKKTNLASTSNTATFRIWLQTSVLATLGDNFITASQSNLLLVGYSKTKINDNITQTITVECEYEDWVYISRYVTLNANFSTAAKYYIGFQPASGSDSLDVTNYTLLIGKNTINPSIYYPETTEAQRILNIKTEDLDYLIDTLQTTYLQQTPPLKTATRNAVVNRVSVTGLVDSRHLVTSGDTLHHIYNEHIFNEYGDYNIFRMTEKAGTWSYKPGCSFVITAEDLAEIGIVPDDTTPPKFSFSAGYMKSSDVTPTFYFTIRYNVVPSAIYNSSYDVAFINNSATAAWYGSGDSDWDHTVTTVDTDSFKVYLHSNIPLPATYKSKSFSSILIQVRGTGAESTTIDIIRPTVVAGTSILENTAYMNQTDLLINDKSAFLYDNINDKYLQQLNIDANDKQIYNLDSLESTDIICSNLTVTSGEITRHDTVNIRQSDKIAFIGDSFTSGGARDFRDKGWVSTVSQLLDYNCEGYGNSGDDYPEMTERIRDNDALYHGSLGIKDFNATYGVVLLAENDTEYHLWHNTEYYLDNAKGLIKALQSLGIKPILSTQFGNYSKYLVYTGLQRLANQYNLQFIDLTSKGYIFDYTRYADFWNSNHPGVRTNSLIFYEMWNNLKTLPRPEKGFKIYRKRTATTGNRLFTDNIDRMKKWKEISIGHRRSTDATVKYYDDLDAGVIASQAETSEYLKLQNGETVSFTDSGLIEVILPGTARNITNVKLKLSDSDIIVHARDMFGADQEDYTTHRLSFVYSGATPSITAGATYTTDDATNYSGHTFTVIGVYEDVVLVTTDQASYNVSPTGTTTQWSGTLTKTSGTGTASISYTNTLSSFHESWYAQYEEPEGAWDQISVSDGYFEIASSDINKYLDYDKITFLLSKSGGFNLTNPYVLYEGSSGKDKTQRKLITDTGGTELLPYTKLNLLNTNWTTSGTPTLTVPSDGITPYGIDSIVVLTTAQTISKTFTPPSGTRGRKIAIKVWARKYPDVFDPTDTFDNSGVSTGDNPINQDTYDFGTLCLNISQTPYTNTPTQNIKFNKLVSLHWQEIVVEAYYTYSKQTQTITIYPVDGDIQIAKISVCELD